MNWTTSTCLSLSTMETFTCLRSIMSLYEGGPGGLYVNVECVSCCRLNSRFAEYNCERGTIRRRLRIGDFLEIEMFVLYEMDLFSVKIKFWYCFFLKISILFYENLIDEFFVIDMKFIIFIIYIIQFYFKNSSRYYFR